MAELYIGLMTGTSLDAIDAAAIDVAAPGIALIATRRRAFEPELRDTLLALARAEQEGLDALGSADTQLGEALAEAVTDLIRDAGLDRGQIAAIGSHGQTIHHQPAGDHTFSLQIGNPHIIAERTGITTVADFRRRDLAAGGQGAPLAPAFHAAAFASAAESRAIVNLGGMANVTFLPAGGPVSGFDTGPGNALMDAWASCHGRGHFDTDGAWAASGTCLPDLLERFRAEEYFARPPPKSTGRERFDLRWILGHLGGDADTARPEDVQATLCELTALTVADAVRGQAPELTRVILCGGGAHNRHLRGRLGALLAPFRLEDSSVFGIGPEWVEAAAFAWLAAQTLAGKPGNLPAVTGARAPVVLGVIHPGAGARGSWVKGSG